ncbi:hypothetical protein D9M71_579490 [compost metagenome]
MTVVEQQADVVEGHQPGEQVGEGDDAQHAGHPPDQVNHPIAEDRQERDARRENQDAGAVADTDQLRNRLPRQHRAGGAETEVHQAHQDNRDRRAIHPELHAAGDHLRQPELRPLRRVQRHHGAAEHLPDQQADQ